jgi:hypothetical protein
MGSLGVASVDERPLDKFQVVDHTVARRGERRGVYTVPVGKSEGKRPL